MGAGWVSGAPVAKPIPKIKVGRSTGAVHAGSSNRAQGAGVRQLYDGVEHDVSPMNAPSLLEPGARQQSENAIEVQRAFLWLEPSLMCDTLCLFFSDSGQSRVGADIAGEVSS